ncbi:uncharacterized protein LOC114356395 [Ostrinia furnacalis]|uniref:uncharacterized protein LOC114356395 n=1 Tax=Ostrinia furnacalis TaxID=93504 RepID=UPI001040739B|nr:uncharacterized protein LOC114356395 [Ostrinia furnacalis]
MERIIRTLVALLSTVVIQSLPINNGFSVKFNPLAVKEELKLKTFGALFAKIPQEITSAESKVRREVVSKAYYPNPPDLGTGCSNQVAKVIFPAKNTNNDEDIIQPAEGLNFINLPIVKQPYDNYKILVATAPPNVKINNEEENTPLVIYVVFPGDGADETDSINIPMIYFVNQHNGKMDFNKPGKAEPILIINSNRTVTGLKSKEIEKFVKFKNKLTKRYNYQISR